MRRIVVGLCAVVAAASCASTSGLRVEEAVVAIPAGQATAAYFSLSNNDSRPDRLVGVRAETGAAEMHRTVHDGERMAMKPVGDLIIGGGETIRFEPGGLHVMLLGVGTLEADQVVRITLEFERAGPLEFDARVVPYREIAP